MKKIYSSPHIEVNLVYASDVLTLSGDGTIVDGFGRGDNLQSGGMEQ